jgi:hypothetical protein
VLLAFSAMVERLQPLDWLFFTGLTTIRQNNMVSKLPRILKSTDNPQVLILGTSLSLYPLAHLDDVLRESRTRWDSTYVRYHICPYSKADYLEKLLSERLGKPVKATNTSIVAAVISDQYLIFDKYLKSGKHPDLVLIFVAPRDLIANNKSKVGKSPTFEILSDFRNLNDILAGNPDLPSLFEFALGKAWTYASVKDDYKSVLTQAMARISGHPVDLFDANNGKAHRVANIFDVDKYWEAQAIYQEPKNQLNQLEDYRQIYDSFDSKQFATQKKFFHKLLERARQEGVEVCVVNMPLTKENLDLMQRDSYGHEAYWKTLSEICIAHGVMLLDPARLDAYELADFEDCAHLNLRGGEKLFKRLAGELAGNRRIASKLSGTGSLVGTSIEKSKGGAVR